MPADADGARFRGGLRAQLKALRRAEDLAPARALLADLAGQNPGHRGLKQLVWEHADFWWKPLTGRRLQLRRRGPDDADFVRRCWADSAFMSRFNRQASPLPADDAALQVILRNEWAAVISEGTAIHWTVWRRQQRLGFVSAVNVSQGQRRAEFLIGLIDASPWDGPEASHLALDFLQRSACIERLTAYFYPENAAALVAAEKLGFVREGCLRGYMRSADGARQDLLVAGLLLDEAFDRRSERLRQRLLAPSQRQK